VQAGFRGREFVGVQGFPDPMPDLLVMQRVGTPGQYHVMKWASENGVATVIDYDDAMWCIDKDNYAWPSWNLSNPTKQHWQWCDDAAILADLITCTTDALSVRYSRRHGRTEVIPNYMPAASLALSKRDNEVFTAGWAGFTATHPGDCQISRPAAEAVLAGGGRLAVVADAAGAAAEWGVDPALVEDLPPRPLGPKYFESLGALDLMLVGLRDTPFNRAKSALKVMESAALGVPSVAPDNAPHRALARTGFPVTLASNPSEWADAAKQWMALSAEDRLEQSLLLREVMRKGYTIEANAEQWAQAWERAMRRKHS